MAILVGSVEVDVVPNAQGFIGSLRRELTPQAVALGDTLGRRIAEGINEGVRSALRDPLNNLPGNPAAAGAKTGERFGGAFNQAVQTRIRAALADLPTPQIGVATTAAEQKIRDLRADLEALGSKRIGVDIDSGDALAEVRRIQLALTRLSADSANVQVRADTAQAAAELAAIATAVEALDGKNANVDVDVQTAGSIGRIQALALAGVAIGPAIIPVAAAAGAAIGAIGPLAVSAAAGVGVLVLAFNGIDTAVKDTAAATASAAKDAAAAATAQASAAASVNSAQAAVASATTSLANTIASADSAAVRSAQAVVDARIAVKTATTAAAAANVSAAAAAVAAERTVQRAVRDSATAVLDLVAARKTAQRQLEDYADRAKDGALAERQGVIDVAEARDALNRARIDPSATPQAVAAAQLRYDQAIQQLAEQRTANKRLADDKTAADKKGVDGSDLVKNAQQRVLDTVNAEALARRNMAKAQAAITATQVAGARRVAAAEENITQALAAQADQGRNSAFSIGQAQASLAQSAAALVTAQAGLAAAQAAVSTAARKAADDLAALTPAGRTFVGFVNGQMRPALKGVRDAAQEGLLPGVQKALEALLPFLPAVADFVGRLATRMGELFTEAGKALQAPFWRSFFADLNDSIIPAITDMAQVIGNLITAFAGIVQAFIPVNATIGGGLVDLTARFAEWSKGLKDNEGFKSFIKYAMDNAPRVLSALASVGKALLHIGEAAAPIGVVVVAAIKLLADIINAIPTPVLTVLLGLLGVYAVRLAAISTWAAAVAVKTGLQATATAALNVAQLVLNGTAYRTIAAWISMNALALTMIAREAAYTAGLVIGTAARVAASVATGAWTAAQWLLNAAMIANPIGLVILAIVAIIAIIVVVVTHFDFFKKAAQRVWQWLKDNWPLLLAIISGPIGLAVLLVTKYWDQIKAGAAAAWNWITDGFGKLVGFFQALPARFAAAAANMWQGFLDGFKSMINQIIDIWNNMSFTIGGGNIAGVAIPSVTLETWPDLPHLATGGVVDRPTLGVFGEDGPEAVVPLNDSRLLADLLGKIRPNAVPGSDGRAVNVHQTINNPLPERATVSGPAGLRRAALALGA